ncbi:hypothetical protein F2Q68_00019771 [Brassica cretica]|uniref:NADP-dependent oxidoreductase domain-containing protein n=1 Tax=Brassica cretica TaxID=69181 RepID=A0A8S9FXE7_BRACR|nr:hypothetical protein F2Q68_00019771 [Brassica cretica]
MAEEAFGVRRMKLGSHGLEVSAQGLGCMGLSAFYGAPTPETNAVALLRHAITAGITFLDTSDFYGPETNELLLGKYSGKKSFCILNSELGNPCKSNSDDRNYSQNFFTA